MRFGITPEKEAALEKECLQFEFYEKDLEEKFIRASGRGGQKVNKTSVCVYLKHIPTGLNVKVDTSRQQGLNRFLARRQLLELYKSKVLNITSDREKKLEKIKKQKARRKRRQQSKLKNSE